MNSQYKSTKSIKAVIRTAQVVILAFAVLVSVMLCSIYYEWMQANQKWQLKWQSENMRTRIEQAEDIVEVRKLAEYCRRSVDSTYDTLVGMNRATLILMIGWVGQLVVIAMCLRRVSRYVHSGISVGAIESGQMQ